MIAMCNKKGEIHLFPLYELTDRLKDGYTFLDNVEFVLQGYNVSMGRGIDNYIQCQESISERAKMHYERAEAKLSDLKETKRQLVRKVRNIR